MSYVTGIAMMGLPVVLAKTMHFIKCSACNLWVSTGQHRVIDIRKFVNVG